MLLINKGVSPLVRIPAVTSVFAIFFLTQLHVIVFRTYFAYFLQPPDFVFIFSLLLCIFVLLCSLVAAFVFVLCLSHALVAVVFSCCNSRLSFCSMVFTIIYSQLGYLSGEGDKKKGEDEDRWQERSRAWITWINGRRIVEKESKEEERGKERSNMK